MNDSGSTVFERIDAAKDALTVRRVFGDSYQSNGVTVIPVAAVRGASGGGEGTGPDSGEHSGSGGGMGFAVAARPLGVYVVRGDRVSWRPAVDVVRVILASEAALVVGLLIVCRLLGLRRNPR